MGNNKEIGIVKVALNEYVNAKDGSILIRKGQKWIPTSLKEILETELKPLGKLAEFDRELKLLENNDKHFTKYAKSHFMVVFNSFKLAYLNGEIELTDETLLELDKQVLNDSVSVKDAIEKHEYIKDMFTKLYLSDGDYITFPQV